MGGNEATLDIQDPNMENSFEKRFGWYVALNRVCENHIEKHDETIEKKVIEVLNQLVYLIEYDKEQDRLMKKAMSKH